MPRPLFITFEGIDGCGKTTQAELLHRRLEQEQIPCILVREPGSTPLGQHLREFLKSRRPISPLAELLAFEAARAELVTTKILPALNAGTTVIADRFTDSSIAYQGGGREMERRTVTALNHVATQRVKPDLTFLLSIDPEEAARRARDDDARFENMDLQFYRRVAEAYDEQARSEPKRIQVLNATEPVGNISQRIWITTGVRLTT